MYSTLELMLIESQLLYSTGFEFPDFLDATAIINELTLITDDIFGLFYMKDIDGSRNISMGLSDLNKPTNIMLLIKLI